MAPNSLAIGANQQEAKVSQWTHIAGIIRLDSILDLIVKPEYRQQLEPQMPNQPTHIKPCLERDLPLGSEGPVKYDILKTRNEESGSIVWGHVAIWGDLRDYNEAATIHRWVDGVCQRLIGAKFVIRDVVMSINVEGKENLLLAWHHEEERIRIVSEK